LGMDLLTMWWRKNDIALHNFTKILEELSRKLIE
jgi:hypothetical protein